MNNALIEILTKLEPTFIQAGEMAVKMQRTAKHHNKTNTGLSVVDIVTEADLAVQEFLLEEMSKTDLVNCYLLAEENTPSVSKFTGTNGYYLAIDPIDGTAIYANGGKCFNVIISLHDGKSFLYAFKHFPVLNWTQKFIGKTYSTVGVQPKFESVLAKKNSILYYRGSPQKTIPALYRELTEKGFEFTYCGNSLEDTDEQDMFVCKEIAGFYSEDPNVYDGFIALYSALITNRKIYSSEPNGYLNLSSIQKRESGFYYSGYYLALN